MTSHNLEDAKEGDEIVILHRWHDTIEVVTRTTKTQVHVRNGRWNRSGSPVGSSTVDSAYLPSAEELARVKDDIRRRATIEDIKRFFGNDRPSRDRLDLVPTCLLVDVLARLNEAYVDACTEPHQ